MRRLGRCCTALAATTSRRTFMKSAALGAAGLPLLAARGRAQTSTRKYRVCEIGHDGDYGHMAGAFAGFPNVTTVAVADPVEKARLQHAARVNAPRTYVDFREMLQKEKPDVVGIGPNRKTYSAQRLEMIKAAAGVSGRGAGRSGLNMLLPLIPRDGRTERRSDRGGWG